MNIHEYQAKQLLAKHGVPVPLGNVARTAAEARGAAVALLAEGCSRVVVKAQIHAGGRGKGVLRTSTPAGHDKREKGPLETRIVPPPVIHFEANR